jgi:hypothetical protein
VFCNTQSVQLALYSTLLAGKRMTTIIVTHEDGEIDEFEFEADRAVITIGRRSTNDVCVPNLSVSGMHAQITFDESAAWIEDLNSTNGTYINGRMITRQQLNNAEEIIIGKTRLAYIQPEIAADALLDTGADFDNDGSIGGLAVPDDEPVPAAPVAGEIAPIEQPDARPENDPANIPVNMPNNYPDAGPEPVTLAVKAQQALAQNIDTTANKQPVEPPHPLDGLESPIDQQPGIELEAPARSQGAVIEIKNGAKSGQILPIDKPVTTLGRPGIQIAAIMRKPDGYFLMHIESDGSVDRPTLNQDAIGDEPVMLHSGDELNVAGIDVEFMLS